MRRRDVQDRAGRPGDAAADQIPTETNAQRTAAAKPAAVARQTRLAGPETSSRVQDHRGLSTARRRNSCRRMSSTDGRRAPPIASRRCRRSTPRSGGGGVVDARRDTPRPRRFLSRTACRLGVTRRNGGPVRARPTISSPVDFARRCTASRRCDKRSKTSSSISTGVSSPGFVGWSVQNLTWAEDLDERTIARGIPRTARCRQRRVLARRDVLSCICSTEEMIYNKMYRRNRNPSTQTTTAT